MAVIRSFLPLHLAFLPCHYAGRRGGRYCATFITGRQADLQRLRDDFNRRADVWSAVPLAVGIAFLG